MLIYLLLLLLLQTYCHAFRFPLNKLLVRNQLISKGSISDLTINEPFATKKRFLQFLDNYFRQYPPFERNITDKRVSIIAKELMEIPFDNYDMHIPPICDRILAPNVRAQKNMFAVIRGSGCGKSRLIEELRLFMDQERSEALFVAISFNYDSSEVQDVFGNKVVSLMFLIVLEMLRVYYGLNRQLISRVIVPFWKSELSKAEGSLISLVLEDLFSAAVSHLIMRHRQYFHQKVTHFCLTIDECTRPLTSFRTNEDLYVTLRQAFLSNGAFDAEARLIMTSLNYALFQKTPSSRDIIPLPCGILREDHVINEIWGKTWIRFASPSVKPMYRLISPRLRILAAGMTQIARLVEFADTALKEYLMKNPNFKPSKYDELVQYLIGYVSNEMTNRYPPEYTTLHLYPLLFHPTEVDMDDPELKANKMIVSSVYTTLLDKVRFVTVSPESSSTTFVPEGSLFRVAGKSKDETLGNIFDDLVTLTAAKKQRIEDLLEHLSYRWLEERVKVLMEGWKKFQSDRTIASFFAIKELPTEDSFQTFREIFIVPTTMLKVQFYLDCFRSRLNQDPREFFSELDMKGAVVYGKKAAPLDCFDYMIALTLESNGLPLPIFIDTKSAKFRKSRAKNYPKDLEQYKTFNASLQHLPDDSSFPLVQALKAGRYLYIYLTDWEFSPNLKRSVDAHCYLMDVKETSRLLTMLFPVYRAARAATV